MPIHAHIYIYMYYVIIDTYYTYIYNIIMIYVIHNICS